MVVSGFSLLLNHCKNGRCTDPNRAAKGSVREISPSHNSTSSYALRKRKSGLRLHPTFWKWARTVVVESFNEIPNLCKFLGSKP